MANMTDNARWGYDEDEYDYQPSSFAMVGLMLFLMVVVAVEKLGGISLLLQKSPSTSGLPLLSAPLRRTEADTPFI